MFRASIVSNQPIPEDTKVPNCVLYTYSIKSLSIHFSLFLHTSITKNRKGKEKERKERDVYTIYLRLQLYSFFQSILQAQMSLHTAVEPDDWLRAIKKKQLKKPAVKVSIEDIMQQTSEDASSPKQKMLPTSPRSLQACLQLGIHPAELEWKPVSSFEETGDGGTEAAIVKQKFYNKLRMVWCAYECA